MSEEKQPASQDKLNQMNIDAVQQDQNDLRAKFYAMEVQLQGVQAQVKTQNALIQEQTRVIGEALGKLAGSGSTVKE